MWKDIYLHVAILVIVITFEKKDVASVKTKLIVLTNSKRNNFPISLFVQMGWTRPECVLCHDSQIDRVCDLTWIGSCSDLLFTLCRKHFNFTDKLSMEGCRVYRLSCKYISWFGLIHRLAEFKSYDDRYITYHDFTTCLAHYQI